jgi:septum formation topological specificity factor MinE
MAEYNRTNMINAMKEHAKGHIQKHRMNVEIALKNSTMIGEHSDVLESVEKELEVIAKYDDQLSVINKYFEQDPLKPNVQ